MTVEYYYLLMSQQDLFKNEVIEEIIRERTNSYFNQQKRNDFWILVSPNFVNSKNMSEKIKETNWLKHFKI